MRFIIRNKAGRTWKIECKSRTSAEQYAKKVSPTYGYCIHPLPLHIETIVSTHDECVIAAVYEDGSTKIDREYRRISDDEIETIHHRAIAADGSYKTVRSTVKFSPNKHLGNAWREVWHNISAENIEQEAQNK